MNIFKIEERILMLGTNTSALNYEKHQYFTLRIESTDSGGLSYQESVMVSLQDVNDGPTDLQLTNSKVNNEDIFTAH